MWQNGTVTDLGTIGNIGTLSDLEAMSMNNNGQIAGWTAVTTTGFLYSNGTITSLSGFFPNAINDSGVMVGGSLIDSGGAPPKPPHPPPPPNPPHAPHPPPTHHTRPQ